MKFALTAALISLASLVSASPLTARSCPDAARYGVLSFTYPNGATSVNAGDTIHVKVDFDCAVNYYGIVPEYYDFTIEVPAAQNNGYEAPIVLKDRRTLPQGSTVDEFDATIPHGYYFANAAYNIYLTDTYPTQGTDGSTIFIRGSVEEPIKINPTPSS